MELIKKHEEFEKRMNANDDKINQMMHFAERLDEENHYASDKIMEKAHSIDKRWVFRMSKVHENDKISTQRRFNSTVSRETYKHGRHSFFTPRALLLRAHARANNMNYRGTVRTPTCNKNYSFSSEHSPMIY